MIAVLREFAGPVACGIAEVPPVLQSLQSYEPSSSSSSGRRREGRREGEGREQEPEQGGRREGREGGL